MAKRTTETLFLRVDPEVARLVRRASEERQLGISQLAEKALRQYLAESIAADDRKNLLSAVEEGMINRIDQRINDTLRRVGNLYAREAFDQAEALFLVKVLVSMQVRDERTLENFLGQARKDATERLKTRVGPEADALAKARDRVEVLLKERDEARASAQAEHQRAAKTEQELTAVKGRLTEANERVRSLEQQVLEERRTATYERQRDEWAATQYEAQGMLRRKSFQEWRAEYLRQNPIPGRVAL